MQAFDLQSEQIESKETVKKTDQLSLYGGPTFNIHRKTNRTVYRRRKHLKSIRRTNFEYLMRQVQRDDIQYNESTVIQNRIKSIHDSIRVEKQSKV